MKSYRPQLGADVYQSQDILCLQRQNNHDQEMRPNNNILQFKTWELFVGPPAQTCWVCSKAQYTLFFTKIDRQDAKKKKFSMQLLP